MPETQLFTIEWWTLDRIRPYEHNPRVISDAAINKVASSIKAFSWQQPIVVDDDSVILAGHTRYQAAKRLGLERVPVHIDPDEVWCASGSGVLARALAAAWPKADRHVVQVGRRLEPKEVAGAMIHVHPLPFGRKAKCKPPFPSDPHYDAKAWEQCMAWKGPGRVLFWNVAAPAQA